jgi:uncharacterized protein (DUF2236 family)
VGPFNFREDLLGRLRRTSQFISGTTFGSTRDAEWLIDKVRTIHLQGDRHRAGWPPYAASDPDLLTWVHVAEVSSFLAAHLRYRNPHLPRAEQDAYYNEIALIAERLGARDVPRSCQQVEDYLQRMRPQLHCDARSLEVMESCSTPCPQPPGRAGGQTDAARGYRPAARLGPGMLGLQQGLQQRLIRLGLRRTAPVLRWAMRDGSAHRAKRRMGID